MGFLFGLMVGGMAAGGGANGPAAALLSQIPMRCLYVFDQYGAQKYIECRRSSLRKEIFAGECPDRNACNEEYNKNIGWEIAALEQIKADAAKAQR